MPRAISAIKPAYGNIRHAEIAPLGLTYHDRFKQIPTELAPFTAYDKNLDAATWLKQFGDSIRLTQSIKPAAQVIKEGKTITSQIDNLSKTSVGLGRELVYWLKQTYQNDANADLPHILEEVPTIAANDAMRDGDTEAMLLQVASIIERIAHHRAPLDAAGYPATNAEAFQKLYDDVMALNTQQSNHRLAIPDGTDQAQLQRNHTYAYIRRVLDVNDILPNRTPAKRDEYRVTAALKTMRANKAPVKRVAKAKPAVPTAP